MSLPAHIIVRGLAELTILQKRCQECLFGMREVHQIFDGLYSYGGSNITPDGFSLHVCFQFNGSEWDIWRSVSVSYFPGVGANPYVVGMHHPEFIYCGTGAINETTKPNEREIRLKMCSCSHTHAHMVYTVVHKSTHPDWDACLADLRWHSHLVMHSQMAHFWCRINSLRI